MSQVSGRLYRRGVFVETKIVNIRRCPLQGQAMQAQNHTAETESFTPRL